VDPSGRFVYVTTVSTGRVSGYTITAGTGALTPIPSSPFDSGAIPVSVTVDPSGRFAYVANIGSNDISAFTITASSGALARITGSPFSAGILPVLPGSVITSGTTQ